jgi:hypothetical protein
MKGRVDDGCALGSVVELGAGVVVGDCVGKRPTVNSKGIAA